MEKREFAFTGQQYYSIVRNEIQHEDDLINQRLTWLTYTEAIIFGGFFALSGGEKGLSPTAKVAYDLLPWFGLMSSIAILVGVCLAIYAINCLRLKFDSVRQSLDPDHEYPDPVVRVWSHYVAFSPPVTLCIMYVVAWVVILLKCG
jgi:SNF family Na+-dependent transporter